MLGHSKLSFPQKKKKGFSKRVFDTKLGVMKLEMGILPTSHCFSAPNRLVDEPNSAKWTAAENKMFENALALHDKDTPDRWHRVADMIPGKTVGDVVRQYRELEADVGKIEAGLVPIPGYGAPRFTLDWMNRHEGFDGFKQGYVIGGKRGGSARTADHERKKGVPWTEDEHKLFLMGLKKYGKGDWRNISRNFLVTRTPTQVASHAQKYFIRQHSGGKDKRRASIHDITTVNLSDIRTPSPDNKAPSPDHLHSAAFSQNSARIPPFQWHQGGNGANMGFGQANGNMFMSNTYGVGNYGVPKTSVHESYYAPQNLAFQMQSGHHYPHG